MRLDRVYTEGEALVALQRLGFDVSEAPLRPGLYEVSHPRIGGARTFTVEQLCNFAEGAAAIDALLKQGPAAQSQGQGQSQGPGAQNAAALGAVAP